jgi:HlyD family secretion protein
VLRVHQESSAVVQPGQQLLELGDPGDLEVEVDVLSSDGVKIAPGAKVLLEHWGGDEPLLGRVRLVEPQARLKLSALGVEEQRVNVIIDLTDPPAKRRRLGDGYRVEARVVIWEGKDVLKVPAGAVFRQGEGWAVYAVAGGRAELRAIEAGKSNGLVMEVRGGLTVGERVIVHPSDRVRDGVAVLPR